jgi:hypothetical protein
MVYAGGPPEVTLRAATVLENRDRTENLGYGPDGSAKQFTERRAGLASNAKRRFHVLLGKNQHISRNEGTQARDDPADAWDPRDRPVMPLKIIRNRSCSPAE